MVIFNMAGRVCKSQNPMQKSKNRVWKSKNHQKSTQMPLKIIPGSLPKPSWGPRGGTYADSCWTLFFGELIWNPKWTQNQSKINQQTNKKKSAFPDTVFGWLLMISKLFVDRFLEPLGPWKWAYGLDETLLFTFYAFQNRARKTARPKAVKK